MAVDQIRSNGNNNTLWYDYDYTKIDDNVVQPNAGDGLAASALNSEEDPVWNDNGVRQQWDMSSLTVASFSSITLWVRAKGSLGTETLDLDVNIGGSWQGASQKSLTPSNVYGWYSVTYNGTWTQEQLNGLIVGLTPNNISAIGATVDVDVVYCDVTYVPVPPSAAGQIF